MIPLNSVLGALVFAGVAAPLLVAGLAFGAAALPFTAVAELLVEAFQTKEGTGTIAMAASGFLLFPHPADADVTVIPITTDQILDAYGFRAVPNSLSRSRAGPSRC